MEQVVRKEKKSRVRHKDGGTGKVRMGKRIMDSKDRTPADYKHKNWEFKDFELKTGILSPITKATETKSRIVRDAEKDITKIN